MKHIKHYLLVFFLLKMLGLNAQIFVDAAATGLNDGTSWADAYSDLNSAISSAPANAELWIAAGKYSPGADAAADHFLISVDVQLYGGFNGTETMRSQRDYETNSTILSGDVLNDDIAGDFSQNKTDNNYHVVWCEASITNNTVIDGFIVEGGNTQNSGGSGDDRRGGGILTYGSPIIQNCTFRENYAFYGGGVYPRNPAANDTKIFNSMFENNSGGYGSGVLTAFCHVLMEDCIIRNNNTIEGAAVNGITGSCTLRRCDFTSNTGGMFGGSAYLIYQSYTPAPVTALIEDCNFDQHTSLDYGSAIGIWDVDVSVTINRTTFTGNSSDVAGAGIFCNMNASLALNNCNFLNNTSPQGAAVQIQDSCVVTIDSCLFEGNEAFGSTTGGAAIMAYTSAPTTITNSTFKNNRSSAGGAIYGVLYNGVDYNLNIENSYFIGNEVKNDGGAINLSGANLSLTNCLLIENDGAIGSAIYASVDEGVNQTIDLTNTTIANNTSTTAIATNGMNLGVSTLNFLNTILDNPAGSFTELGTPTTINSYGGNLSSDNSLVNFLTSTNDLNNTSANFFDGSNGEYNLDITSPCINKGIDTGAPLFDIEQNMRFGITDMGAYEYQGILSNKGFPKEDNNIRIFPNPVGSDLNFTIENEATGLLKISVFDMAGALILKKEVNKSTTRENYSIDVANLPAGAYQLTIVTSGKGEAKTFVKN